jgi:hypothetical protein
MQALIFDSVFNSYRGIEVIFRIFNGTIKKGEKVKFVATGKEYFADIGSSLYLFNFPSESLQELYKRFNTENKLYDIIRNKSEQEASADIYKLLNIKLENSVPEELTEEIPINESNYIPGSAVKIKKTDEGYDIKGSYVDPNTESGNNNLKKLLTFLNNQKNEYNGYYVHFENNGGIYLGNVFTSGKYEELIDKSNFRIGIKYKTKNGNISDQFFTVENKENSFDVQKEGLQNKSIKSYKSIDDIIESLTAGKDSAQVSYFEIEKNNNIFDYIYQKGRVNRKTHLNTKAKVTPGQTTLAIDTPVEEKPSNVQKEVLDFNTDDNITFTLKTRSGNIVINKVNTFDKIDYKLNEGVTEDQLNQAVKDSKSKNLENISNYLFKDSGLFSTTASFSTILKDQLSIIKDFTKQC